MEIKGWVSFFNKTSDWLKYFKCLHFEGQKHVIQKNLFFQLKYDRIEMISSQFWTCFRNQDEVSLNFF